VCSSDLTQNLMMAHPIRILYSGAIYHVTTRGNELKELFQEDDELERMQQKLGEFQAPEETRMRR
jgi:hypothetical protein